MSATLFGVRKEMLLARLDWTRRKVPTRSLRLAHTGVFETMAATTDRDLCSSLLRRSKDHTSGLAPSISAIRFCLHQGLYVQLLEWMPALPNAGNCGLDEYVLAISEAVATITTAAQGAKPSLIGHSSEAHLQRYTEPFSLRASGALCF